MKIFMVKVKVDTGVCKEIFTHIVSGLNEKEAKEKVYWYWESYTYDGRILDFIEIKDIEKEEIHICTSKVINCKVY